MELSGHCLSLTPVALSACGLLKFIIREQVLEQEAKQIGLTGTEIPGDLTRSSVPCWDTESGYHALVPKGELHIREGQAGL